MIKTIISYKGVIHAVNTNMNHGVEYHCLCNKFIKKGKRSVLKDSLETPPTCPECIKRLLKELRNAAEMKEDFNYYKSSFQQSISIIENLIHRQKSFYANSYAEENKKSYSEGSFPFIPESTFDIFQEFKVLYNYLRNEKRWSGHKRFPTKFIDAGCGIGNIMLLAKGAGLCSAIHGIEYSKNTYGRAKSFLGLRDGETTFKIFKDDILKFKHYSNYDIIYFYCPFCHDKLQIMFEELVEDSMAVGAVLIPHLKKGSTIRTDERFELIKIGTPADTYHTRLHRHVFIKVKDDKRKETQLDRVSMGGLSYKSAKRYKLIKD